MEQKEVSTRADATGTAVSREGGKDEDKMANQHFTFASLQELREFYHDLPEGSTASGIASDLEAGNIDEFTVQFPGPEGKVVEVSYTGPVAEGYVSPFETRSEEGELE